MCYKNLFLLEQQSPPTQNGTTAGPDPYGYNELDLFDYSTAPPLSHGPEPGDATTSPMSFASDCSPPPQCDLGLIDTSYGGVPRYPAAHHQQRAGYNSECDPFFSSQGVRGQLSSRPVYNGFANPPEYAYQQHQQYNHIPTHLPGYLQIMQGFQDQYSPEDLDVKFAVPPSSLSSLAAGGNAGSPPSGMINPQSTCKVCNDVASGNHFGVLSCEACKSFFRRSVRAGARYACRGTRNCSVEKHTRNRCQYCRLQKCMQTGMRKEAVQEERAPPVTRVQRAGTPTQLGYSPSPAFSPTSFPGGPPLPPIPSMPSSFRYDGPVSPIMPSNFMTQSRLSGSLPNLKMGCGSGGYGDYDFPPMTSPIHIPPVEPYTGGGSRPSTPSSMNMTSGVPSSTAPPYSESGSSTMYNTGSTQNAGVSPFVLVTADMQTEALPDNVTPSDHGIKLEDIFEGARQSLLRVIEWSKRIPAFTTLSLDDQVKLLKSCWCEHVLLKQATRIGPHSDTLLLSSGITCRRDQIEDPEVRRIVERVSHEISYWFDVLHVDKVEMACLKGIILFNPDAKGLNPGTRKRVEIFQEQILQALETRCKTMYPVTPLRFSKLLLRLPPLRAAALESTQHMEVQRTLGNAKLDTIFGELLDFD